MPLDLVLRRFVLLGAPFALAVLMLFRPRPYDDYSKELAPITGWWIYLHTVAFVLLAFEGAFVRLLMDGLRGASILVSSLGAVIFSNVGDVVAGTSTGILARAAADAPPGERDTLGESTKTLFAHPARNLSFEAGVYVWVVALIAAAVVLYRAGAPRSPLLLDGNHAVPFGSLAFGCFSLGELWPEFAWRAPARAESPRVRSTVSDLR